MPNFNLSLYLVTDQSLSLDRPLKSVIEAAVRGGVSMVQLREKNASTREFYDLAMKVKAYIKPYNVPLIINDRLDVALACNAEGIHLGQNDIPYDIARKLLGKDKIIGLSVESVMDAERANNLDVDYIAISPVFDTPTKTDTSKALGLGGVKDILKITRHRCVAIGGISKENAADIISAGAEGIAVVSAIMSSENPQDSARQLRNLVDHTKNRLG
ncbi:MAG: thiamine phosphate synthase [Prevotella sp.]|jgi:thiamine-phosphate pyrophosphorylase|nr:thiamine phosphate synthase [Prevotella sp.]